jgi:hypothetical protein
MQIAIRVRDNILSSVGDRTSTRNARDCTSHVGCATRHVLHAPSGPHCRGDFFWPLGSAPVNGRKVAFESASKNGEKAEEIDRFEW